MTSATQAFEYFTQGLATHQWDAFLDMLTEDFSFWFPTGPFHGLNTGKERAKEFLQYVSQSFPEGLFVTLEQVMSNETTVVFEFRSEGKLRGEAYKNRVAVFLMCEGIRFVAIANTLAVMANPINSVDRQ